MKGGGSIVSFHQREEKAKCKGTTSVNHIKHGSGDQEQTTDLGFVCSLSPPLHTTAGE